MSYRDVQDIKDILVLLTATYAAYRAYRQLCELKEKNAERKKRRMLAFERSRINERDSSSSEEETQTELGSNFLSSTDTMEIADQREMSSQSSYLVEEIDMNPRPSKGKFSSSEASGKLTETFASKLSDQQFKKQFRISRKTMAKLHDSFVNSTEYKNIFKLGNKPKIPAKYYMMMFLWFVGRRCSYLDLARIFNMSLSRSWSTVDTVTQFFLNSAKDYIRFPDTASEKRLCAENFQEIAGFPNVLGCLVCTHIEVRAQLENSKRPPSPNENITATIQAICDSKGRFLDVYVNASRNVHHTEMLQESPIGEKLKEMCQGRYHILAEGEYKIREWLLTPYKETNTPGYTLYNQKHRSTMEEVSDSIGALQRRFQQLTSMSSFSPNKIKRMIIACCVLHNICLEKNDHFAMGDPLAIPSSVLGPNAEIVAEVIADDTHLRRIGELKRRQIMEEIKMM